MALILDFHPPVIYKEFFRHPKISPMLRAYLESPNTLGIDFNIRKVLKI
jgi:hypothetical protein